MHLARYSVIAFLALAYSTWAIWGAGYDFMAKGFMLLIAGIPVYIWLKWRQSREMPSEDIVMDDMLDPFTAPPMVWSRT